AFAGRQERSSQPAFLKPPKLAFDLGQTFMQIVKSCLGLWRRGAFYMRYFDHASDMAKDVLPLIFQRIPDHVSDVVERQADAGPPDAIKQTIFASSNHGATPSASRLAQSSPAAYQQ